MPELFATNAEQWYNQRMPKEQFVDSADAAKYYSLRIIAVLASLAIGISALTTHDPPGDRTPSLLGLPSPFGGAAWPQRPKTMELTPSTTVTLPARTLTEPLGPIVP